VTGDDLRRKVDDRVQRGEDLTDAILAEAKEYQRSFRGAVGYWQTWGRSDLIAAYLRSDRPLLPDEREWLAGFVEGKIKLPRGRPPGFNSKYSELLQWTAAGEKRRGLNAKAIEAAAAEWCPSGMEPVDFQEKLATFVARSKRRR